MENLGPIDYKTLMGLHNNYLAEKEPLLKIFIRKGETHSIWFQMAEFRIFLKQLLDDPDVSGVRTYLGNYSPEFPPENPIHMNKLTVGFVATQYNPHTGIHEDYHSSKIAGKNLVYILTDPYNHGKICPPEICPY